MTEEIFDNIPDPKGTEVVFYNSTDSTNSDQWPEWPNAENFLTRKKDGNMGTCKKSFRRKFSSAGAVKTPLPKKSTVDSNNTTGDSQSLFVTHQI